MSYLGRLQRASFGGIEFPFQEYSLRGAYRFHTHEYRHTPAGSNEKQGRKLYGVRLVGIFDETLSVPMLPSGKKGFPGYYPDGLNLLRGLFEAGTTQPLVLPTIGTFDAFITGWEQTAVPSEKLSGERVAIELTEDRESSFLLDSILVNLEGTSVEAASATMLAFALELELEPGDLEKIQAAYDAALVARDQFEAGELLLAAKIEGVARMVNELERTLRSLNHPENWPLSQAMKELAASLRSLAQAASDFVAATVRTYTVPKPMTIQQASGAIFGTTSRTFDLLSLNEITDSSKILAGTKLRYLSDV